MSRDIVSLGIDPSLTETGVAVMHWMGTLIEPRAVIGKAKSKPSADDVGSRRDRFDVVFDGIDKVVHAAGLNVDIVVVEGPSLGAPRQGGTFDRAGLWWLIVDKFLERGIPVLEVPPARLKKFATGKGTAAKADVAAGITRLWPDLEPRGDNEFDALGLSTIGSMVLGAAPRNARGYHRAVVADILSEGLLEAALRGT